MTERCSIIGFFVTSDGTEEDTDGTDSGSFCDGDNMDEYNDCCREGDILYCNSGYCVYYF